MGKAPYIIYICMRVGIYSAGGGPALVQQGENGRGPKIGINFNRRQGGRGAHPTETELKAPPSARPSYQGQLHGHTMPAGEPQKAKRILSQRGPGRVVCLGDEEEGGNTERGGEMAREREDTGMHLPGLLSGGEARDEPTQERTGTRAPGEAKKSARRLLKLCRFLSWKLPSPF